MSEGKEGKESEGKERDGPEASPWFKADKLDRFEEVRRVTGKTRPGGNHGSRLVEIVPGMSCKLYRSIFTILNKVCGLFTSMISKIQKYFQLCVLNPRYYSRSITRQA